MLVEFEQHRIVQTTLDFELFDKKCLTNFEKVKYCRHFGRRFWNVSQLLANK